MAVVRHKRGEHKDKYMLVVGVLAHKVCMEWLVETVQVGKTNCRAFLVDGGKVKNAKPFLFVRLNVVRLVIT